MTEEEIKRLELDKVNGVFAMRVIVEACGIQIKYLAIQHLFRGTDVPDSIKEFFPVISASVAFQTLIIQRKSLDHVLF